MKPVVKHFEQNVATAILLSSNRFGFGIIALKTGDKTGGVIGALTVRDTDEIMLITVGGQMVRTFVRVVREGEGTVLDNSMIVYGSAISDGNAHNHDNLPVLLAGGGGGTIRPGRHVRYAKETPMANLYVSMLERMGAPTERFGDSTGLLKELA